MDWKPPGCEQSLAGLTVDRFKYPSDSRVTDLHGPSHRLINGVRRIGGKPYLFCGAQGTGSLEIYKFGEGCVAAPCGYVAGASTWRPENGKRWPEDAETFIWTDANGDGAADAAEFAAADRKPRWGFIFLFVAYGYGLIRVHRMDDGGCVGTIRPDINGFKGSGGCVDSDNVLNVTLRKNGEYVLFLEDAGLNHVMMFRWTLPQG